MQAEGDAIFSYFTSVSAFTSVVSTRLYPLVAKEDVQKPFVVYSISEEPQTKESDQVTVTLAAYFDVDNYRTCAGFADTIKSIIQANSDYNWISSSMNFVEDDRSPFAVVEFELINI